MKTVLLIQVFSTLFMLGLIWFVQIVHYPMFDGVGSEGFAAYEERHQRLTTYVVMPVMLLELATAIALVPCSPADARMLPWIGLILLAIIWISTWALQVPAHNVLASGFSAEAYRKLVTTNWLRTIAWSARAAILVVILSHRLQ